jgi:hypothetical protein
MGEKRKLTNVDEDGNAWDEEFAAYTFKDGASESERPASQTVHVEFWENDAYFVDWVYDKKQNVYLRENGGEKHVDRNTKKQLSASNVIVLFMTERNANDGYEDNAHLLYGTKGQGKALVFLDGAEIEGTWKKSGRTGRTIITDSSGEEVEFNRGTLWFEIVATDGIVNVE